MKMRQMEVNKLQQLGCWLMLLLLVLVMMMGSHVTMGMSVSKVMRDAGHKEGGGEEKKEKWLEDYISKDYTNEMMSDAAINGKWVDDERCPPPPNQVPEFGCLAQTCTSDKECQTQAHRCCYNGCIFTCMAYMPPPPVVDWKREPPRRVQSGHSWLVPGPQDDDQVDSCSTTEILDDDEDALLCPHGYMCHIEDPGDPAKGRPNRGRCEKEYNTQLAGSSGRKFRLKTKKTANQSECVFDNAIISNWATFWYDRHPCTCQDGAITCVVGKRRGRS